MTAHGLHSAIGGQRAWVAARNGPSNSHGTFHTKLESSMISIRYQFPQALRGAARAIKRRAQVMPKAYDRAIGDDVATGRHAVARRLRDAFCPRQWPV